MAKSKRNINGYDLDEDTLEFIQAVERWKARTGRPFPKWSEIIEILRDLGWEKTSK